MTETFYADTAARDAYNAAARTALAAQEKEQDA
jgi:hypothetical protein